MRALIATAALAIAALVGASSSAGALGGGLSCQYVEAGAAGAPGNELRIQAEPFTFVIVERVGDRVRIAVGEEDEPERNIDCLGATPTVHNVDAIRMTGGIKSSFSNPSVVLDQAEGPFAPGATGEGAGSPEIEIYARFKGHSSVSIYGQPVAEAYDFGAVGRTLTADPNHSDPVPDNDLFVRAPVSVFVAAGDGDDLLDAGGVPGRLGLRFSGDAGDDTLIGTRGISSLSGDDGDDRLFGGPGYDFVSGGSGDDTISTGGRRDLIRAGSGVDDVSAGGGEDRVWAKDGQADMVRCGKRRDEARLDASDTRRSCELVNRRQRRTVRPPSP